MGLKVERITFAFSMAAFVVAAIFGWVYFNQPSNDPPPPLIGQDIGRVIEQKNVDLFHNSNDPILGNPDGDVTLVEFFDYRCGYCKQVHPIVMDFLQNDGNIRYVAKEFPILGPVSTLAAQAALASQKQGKYAAYSDALMSARNLNEDSVFEIARKVGLDPLRLLDDIDLYEGEINATITANISLARELALQGTPAFIAGQTLIPGAIDRAGLEKLIADARALNVEEK